MSASNAFIELKKKKRMIWWILVYWVHLQRLPWHLWQSPTVVQTSLYLFMRVCIQINWVLVNRCPCSPNLRSKRWRGSGHSHRTPSISCVHRDNAHALYYAAQVKNNKMLHEHEGKLCVRRLRESTIDTQPQSRNNSQRKTHSMESNKY